MWHLIQTVKHMIGKHLNNPFSPPFIQLHDFSGEIYTFFSGRLNTVRKLHNFLRNFRTDREACRTGSSFSSSGCWTACHQYSVQVIIRKQQSSRGQVKWQQRRRRHRQLAMARGTATLSQCSVYRRHIVTGRVCRRLSLVILWPCIAHTHTHTHTQ